MFVHSTITTVQKNNWYTHKNKVTEWRIHQLPELMKYYKTIFIAVIFWKYYKFTYKPVLSHTHNIKTYKSCCVMVLQGNEWVFSHQLTSANWQNYFHWITLNINTLENK